MKRKLISFLALIPLIFSISAQIDQADVIKSLDAVLQEKAVNFTSADLTLSDAYSSLNTSVVHS